MSNYPSGYSEPEPLDNYLKRQDECIKSIIAENKCLVQALEDIAARTYDSRSEGAQAQRIAQSAIDKYRIR